MTLLYKIAAGAVAAALIAGLWLRGDHYADRARTSEALLGSALAIGNANAALADAQAKASRRIDAISALNAIQKQDLRRKSDERRKDIIYVPLEEDGPLAPVLRDQLDRLPQRSGADPAPSIAAAGSSGNAPPSD